MLRQKACCRCGTGQGYGQGFRFHCCSYNFVHQRCQFLSDTGGSFSLKGKNGLLENLGHRLDRRQHAVILVAEGAGQNYCLMGSREKMHRAIKPMVTSESFSRMKSADSLSGVMERPTSNILTQVTSFVRHRLIPLIPTTVPGWVPMQCMPP